MKRITTALLGLALLTMFVGCRSFRPRHLLIPPRPATAAVIAAGVASGVASNAVHHHSTRRATAYRTAYVQPTRVQQSSSVWETDPVVQPAPAPPPPRFVPRHQLPGPPTPPRPPVPAAPSHEITISASYWDCILSGTLSSHHGYFNSYDDLDLDDTFGIDEGGILSVAFGFKPRRGIGLRATASYGSFESEEHYYTEPYFYDSVLYPGDTGQATLSYTALSVLMDFGVAAGRAADFHLLIGVGYMGATLESSGVTEKVETVCLAGGAELAFHIVPSRLDIELAIDLALGFDGARAGGQVALCWKPVKFLNFRIGLRAQYAYLEDINQDYGESISLGTAGAFAELGFRIA